MERPTAQQDPPRATAPPVAAGFDQGWIDLAEEFEASAPEDGAVEAAPAALSGPEETRGYVLGGGEGAVHGEDPLGADADRLPAPLIDALLSLDEDQDKQVTAVMSVQDLAPPRALSLDIELRQEEAAPAPAEDPPGPHEQEAALAETLLDESGARRGFRAQPVGGGTLMDEPYAAPQGAAASFRDLPRGPPRTAVAP